jgi:hypothetical protein
LIVPRSRTTAAPSAADIIGARDDTAKEDLANVWNWDFSSMQQSTRSRDLYGPAAERK